MESFKQILMGFALFAFLVAIAMFFSGNKNQADFSKNLPTAPCDGSGNGHPLDNCW